ncbi:hypothetical protein BCR33DRAFT_813060 [Rhizoclosmatium globosum]|uniref:Helicase ATP-binding domain-containing protein n=2 Tax=Rhizoclosmatium globosum TaxID=329046 RepID=A0A1Y2CGW6_9FUNG|nr:hypothetical protein BCR33DRAFT_813060 [Rhizoclosmatium globosum]|eukprot:ORY46157.1 hypothetical protein BCR33DRAFT_813060 [Rhizoclosmatium globosum]
MQAVQELVPVVGPKQKQRAPRQPPEEQTTKKQKTLGERILEDIVHPENKFPDPMDLNQSNHPTKLVFEPMLALYAAKRRIVSNVLITESLEVATAHCPFLTVLLKATEQQDTGYSVYLSGTCKQLEHLLSALSLNDRDSLKLWEVVALDRPVSPTFVFAFSTTQTQLCSKNELAGIFHGYLKTIDFINPLACCNHSTLDLNPFCLVLASLCFEHPNYEIKQTVVENFNPISVWKYKKKVEECIQSAFIAQFGKVLEIGQTQSGNPFITSQYSMSQNTLMIEATVKGLVFDSGYSLSNCIIEINEVSILQSIWALFESQYLQTESQLDQEKWLESPPQELQTLFGRLIDLLISAEYFKPISLSTIEPIALFPLTGFRKFGQTPLRVFPADYDQVEIYNVHKDSPSERLTSISYIHSLTDWRSFLKGQAHLGHSQEILVVPTGQFNPYVLEQPWEVGSGARRTIQKASWLGDYFSLNIFEQEALLARAMKRHVQFNSFADGSGRLRKGLCIGGELNRNTSETALRHLPPNSRCRDLFGNIMLCSNAIPKHFYCLELAPMQSVLEREYGIRVKHFPSHWAIQDPDTYRMIFYNIFVGNASVAPCIYTAPRIRFLSTEIVVFKENQRFINQEGFADGSDNYPFNIDIVNITQKLVIVTSAPGTGKTQMMQSIVTNNPNASVLAITPSRMLVTQTQTRLGSLFHHYHETPSPWTLGIPGLRIVTTPQSSFKAVTEFNIILLDELDESIIQLTSTITSAYQAGTVFDKWKWLFNQPNTRVFVFQSEMSSHALDLMLLALPDIDRFDPSQVKLVKVNYSPPQTSYNLYGALAPALLEFLGYAIPGLENNERSVILCTSVKALLTVGCVLMHHLQNEAERENVLVCHASIADTPAVAAFIKDPNSDSNPKIIGLTTIGKVGISLVGTSNILVVIDNGALSIDGIDQLAGRARWCPNQKKVVCLVKGLEDSQIVEPGHVAKNQADISRLLSERRSTTSHHQQRQILSEIPSSGSWFDDCVTKHIQDGISSRQYAANMAFSELGARQECTIIKPSNETPFEVEELNKLCFTFDYLVTKTLEFASSAGPGSLGVLLPSLPILGNDNLEDRDDRHEGGGRRGVLGASESDQRFLQGISLQTSTSETFRTNLGVDVNVNLEELIKLIPQDLKESNNAKDQEEVEIRKFALKAILTAKLDGMEGRVLPGTSTAFNKFKQSVEAVSTLFEAITEPKSLAHKAQYHLQDPKLKAISILALDLVEKGFPEIWTLTWNPNCAEDTIVFEKWIRANKASVEVLMRQSLFNLIGQEPDSESPVAVNRMKLSRLYREIHHHLGLFISVTTESNDQTEIGLTVNIPMFCQFAAVVRTQLTTLVWDGLVADLKDSGKVTGEILDAMVDEFNMLAAKGQDMTLWHGNAFELLSQVSNRRATEADDEENSARMNVADPVDEWGDVTDEQMNEALQEAIECYRNSQSPPHGQAVGRGETQEELLDALARMDDEYWDEF